MFRINRIRLEIRALNQGSTRKLYGFDIPFENGLNIIAGHNSKGKSTISSCIYYALGMEELLGGQNEKALDKAVKDEFNIYFPERTVEYKVFQSEVYAEIENDKAEIVTIFRTINPGPGEDRKKNTIAIVYGDKFENINSTTSQHPLYIRGIDNNENEFGFYYWLAKFIGLKIPTVINTGKAGGESPLYLQCVFPALFIEQSKGWSDFFATTPYFGIPKAKEKVVEYILGLNELNISIEKDRITKEKKDLQSKWHESIRSLEVLALEQGGKLINVPSEIVADEKKLDLATLQIKDDPKQVASSIESVILEREQELGQLRQIPVVTVGEKKTDLREKFERVQTNYQEVIKKLRAFDESYNLQRNQLQSLVYQQGDVSKELSHQKGIKRVFDEAIIKEDIYSICPTCSQNISTDLISSNHIVIERMTLDENIAYLDGQVKLINTSIDSLKKIIEEKNQLRKYFLRNQRDLEEEIKIMMLELVTDDRQYSEVDTLKRVRLEKSITDYKFLLRNFQEHLGKLRILSGKFYSILTEEADLEASTEEDKVKLNQFESTYKQHFLFPFGYTSNLGSHISIQRTDPFKYFPVFKFSAGDLNPQSIRVNSSASDFVRNIWAYSFSLLVEGINHPGIIIFDEPGQHRIDRHSLSSLFTISSSLKEKQIIIFTSVDRKDANDQTVDLTDLLKNLERERDYFIYELDEIDKCIKELD